MRRSLLACMVALAGAGCSWPGTSAPAIPAVEGLARFPSYRVQAEMSEVAMAATVSLIEPAASRTVSTSLTDAAGHFRLGFNGFRPAKQVYILEAIKGLSANAVGHDSVRLRTLIEWNGSNWTSLSSTVPGAPVTLDASTTALAIIQSLRQGGATPVTPSALIGSLVVGDSPTFMPGDSGVTGAEFGQARALVLTVLLSDIDPLEAVVGSNGTYSLKPGILNLTPVLLTALLPDSGSVGTSVTLMGSGFATSPAGSTVSFSPNVVAPVLAASASALTVRVPAGATTGPLSLLTNGVLATASFTVLPPVNGSLSY